MMHVDTLARLNTRKRGFYDHRCQFQPGSSLANVEGVWFEALHETATVSSHPSWSDPVMCRVWIFHDARVVFVSQIFVSDLPDE